MTDERLFGGTMINPFWANTHLPGLRRLWRRLTVGLAALGLLLALLGPAAAAPPDGSLDPSFNPGVQKIPIIRGWAGYTTTINSVNTFNGYSLIWGYFTSLTLGSETYRTSLARLTDTNGAVDPAFDTSPTGPIPIQGEVRAVWLTANNDTLTSPILIGGQFSLTDPGTSKTYYNLARLKWTGSAYAVDTDFPQILDQVVTGTGVPVSAVNNIAVQGSYGSGPILVGGYNLKVLESAGGDASKAYHLIKLNSDCTYNSTYSTNNPARALPGGYVQGIRMYPSNEARLFGTMPRTSVQGNPPYNDYMQLLSAADLSTITKSLGEDKFDGPIYNMQQNSPGAPWVVSGLFKKAFNTYINHVAVIKADLTDVDNSTAPYTNFNAGVIAGGGADHAVMQIFITGSGQLILGGNLTSFNNTTCGHLVRLNTNGTVDLNFNNPVTPGVLGSGVDDRTFGLFVIPGFSNILGITGAFRNYNDKNRGGIASIDMSGNLQDSFKNFASVSNTPGTVYAMEWGPNGQQMIGGDFTGVGGKWHQNLALLKWDGSTDHTFVNNVDGVVRKLWSDLNNNMLVGGTFGAANGVGRTSLAHFKGTISMSPPPYSYPILSYDLNMNFNPKAVQSDSTVANIHVLEGNDNTGTILIGGDLANVGDSPLTLQPRTAVARLLPSGFLDSSFTFTPPGALTNMKVKEGGAPEGISGVYIIGKATYNNSLPVGFCTHLLDNGGVDPGFGPSGGTTPVDHYLLFDGQVLSGGGRQTQIYLGGDFTHVLDGSTNPARNHLALISANGVLDTTFVPPGPDGTIAAMEVQKNGKIVIGGAFTSYGGTSRNGVARLNADGSLDTSFNPGTGTNGPVLYLNVDSWNGTAYLCGAFTTYNNVSRLGLARIYCGPIMKPTSAAINLLLLMD
jgi:hypothetical protein